MKIQLSDLTTECKWRAATGFDKQRFEKLLELFRKSYIKIYGKSVKERQVQTKIDYCLNSEKDLLFFTLFSLKSSLTYDLLGLVCGMEASNAKRNQKTGLDVLQRIFKELGHAPGYQLKAGHFDPGSAGVLAGTFKRPAGTLALPGKPLCGQPAKCPG